MTDKKRIAAVIVAAGKGLRMGGDTPKQYLELNGDTVLGHTLKAFEESCVDDVIIVCPPGDEDYVKTAVVSDRFAKVRAIVGGGAERFESCERGIRIAADGRSENSASCFRDSNNGILPGEGMITPDFIMIHDGVRALVTPEVIGRAAEALLEHPAVCPGVPAKDTIRKVDVTGDATEVCDRRELRIIQTPQGFATDMIVEAYRLFDEERERDPKSAEGITDDAMLVEKYLHRQVFVTEGSYENIKITTPEDMLLAEAILAKRG